MKIKIETDSKVIEIEEHGTHHIKIKISQEEALINWKQRNRVANILLQAIQIKDSW